MGGYICTKVKFERPPYSKTGTVIHLFTLFVGFSRLNWRQTVKVIDLNEVR